MARQVDLLHFDCLILHVLHLQGYVAIMRWKLNTYEISWMRIYLPRITHLRSMHSNTSWYRDEVSGNFVTTFACLGNYFVWISDNRSNSNSRRTEIYVYRFVLKFRRPTFRQQNAVAVESDKLHMYCEILWGDVFSDTLLVQSVRYLGHVSFHVKGFAWFPLTRRNEPCLYNGNSYMVRRRLCIRFRLVVGLHADLALVHHLI